MNITFLRQCFANNSSSTHSLVFCDGMIDKGEDTFEYGWSNFVLASKEAKLRYMLTNLWENWKDYNRFYDIIIDQEACLKFSVEHFKNFVNEYLSDVFDEDIIDSFTSSNIDYYHVDHQSRLSFPLHRNPSYKIGDHYFNIPFIKDFVNFIVNEPFVILGGNDNEETCNDTSMDQTGEQLHIRKLWTFLKDRGNAPLCEKDDKTGEYILSDSRGPLLKIVFGEKKNEKSSFPYLVDIKITEKCNNRCKFCYMDSKENGKHADFYSLYNLADVLKDSNVFEIVLGGGEVSEYEHGGYHTIRDVIGKFHDCKFKVSLTTKNYEFYKHNKWDDICKDLDSMAVSCFTLDDLKKAKKLRMKYNESINKANKYNSQFTVQYILEYGTVSYLKKFLDRCKKNGLYLVTLVGAKECGRGNKFKWNKHNADWIKVAKESGLKIGIDSVLAKKYYNELTENGVEQFYIESREGKSTCFIDAVNGSICTSSFGGERIKTPINGRNFNKEKFLDIFSKV